MKKWSFLTTAGLCALLAASSCSKDDDDPENVGNKDWNDIPTGKVAFHKYGMSAFFPEGEWGKEDDPSFLNMTGPEAEFSRSALNTYLLADSFRLPGAERPSYKTLVCFSRFSKAFDSEEEVNALIEDFQFIEDGKWDKTGNDYNLELDSVGNIDFATVGKYTGSLVETWNKFGYYQGNYFIYSAEKDSLYLVSISLDREYVANNDPKYQQCLDILNTFRIE